MKYLWVSLLLGNVAVCLAWTTGGGASIQSMFSVSRRSASSPVVLHDAAEGEQEEFKRKMALVRNLQMSYYKSNNFTHSSFDPASGTIADLPLWRVGWTELPGRSNILSVHEAMYTNMFESLLYKEKPWYIGHLYLPKGSENMKRDVAATPNETNNKAYKLKTWDDEIQEGEDKEYPRSAVVGTLMRIADYRRMEDGKLLLLVEALERFVVTNVKQELPYSIADVQLLPDTEEVDPDVWVDSCTEGEIRDARSLALVESFQRYHPYEYDETFQLPIPQKKDLQTQDIHGSLLTLMVPYVPLSKTADLSKLTSKPLHFDLSEGKLEETNEAELVVEINEEETQQTEVKDEQPCLEQQLLKGKILKDFVHPDDSVMNLSLDELEYKVWIEINHFLSSTKTPVSPVLLGLVPVGIEWPTNFHLRKIANGIANRTDLKHNFVQVSPLLPTHRRLRRLSYSATTLLENKPGMEGLKQELLECASTRGRLVMILEKLEEYNSESVWGEFE